MRSSFLLFGCNICFDGYQSKDYAIDHTKAPTIVVISHLFRTPRIRLAFDDRNVFFIDDVSQNIPVLRNNTVDIRN